MFVLLCGLIDSDQNVFSLLQIKAQNNQLRFMDMVLIYPQILTAENKIRT